MIQWLVATTEGPNTFWGKTAFKSLDETKRYKNIYRENKGDVEVLMGKKEGSNTLWEDFDPRFDSVADMFFFSPPHDKRTVLRVKP